jgi:hypothetical protein
MSFLKALTLKFALKAHATVQDKQSKHIFLEKEAILPPTEQFLIKNGRFLPEQHRKNLIH